MWVVAPFFPAYESWQASRVTAALPLRRSERFTLAAIYACAATALFAWASQFQLSQLRQVTMLWQDTPHTSWPLVLLSGLAGILFVLGVTVSVVPRETSASAVWRALPCIEILGCSYAMRYGPSKLPSTLAALEGAILAIWVHATLWCPYEFILATDAIISVVDTPRTQPSLASTALPSIWVLDSPTLCGAWATWALLSMFTWHRCWRWRRRLAARAARPIGLTQATATSEQMLLALLATWC